MKQKRNLKDETNLKKYFQNTLQHVFFIFFHTQYTDKSFSEFSIFFFFQRPMPNTNNFRTCSLIAFSIYVS